MVELETAAGRTAELDRIAVVACGREVAALEGAGVDYLEAVLAHRDARTRRGSR